MVPFLIIDGGKPMPQSTAILRYVGRIAQYGDKPLYPEDPLEAFACDETIEMVNDMFAPLMKTMGIKDQAEKEAARAALFAEDGALTPHLQKLDNRFDGDRTSVTIGDLYVFCFLNSCRTPSWLDGVPPGALDKYANLNKHHELIANLPPILEYYKDKQDRDTFKPLG